jgi:hypothetical protein
VTAPIAEYVSDAAALVADLVGRPEVAERWSQESACAGMTVGGLAFHLADQAGIVVRLMGEPPRDEDPIPVLEHYRRAAWVHTGLDEEFNVGIREGADEKAAGGPEALAAQVRADLASLPHAVSEALTGERSPDTVHIPWQGWSLSSQDFLVTRLMEMVVHADDLAASVDLDPPTFPGPVVEAVVGLLAAVAVDTHGATAVVRALSRPQRAPASISAF